MSRRYQTGNVVKYGNWWIVRFRVDVPNQDQRVLTYERICPVNGPGRLTVHDRRDRAASILKEKGVNSCEQFARTNNGTTFKQQAAWFMANAIQRKRRPIKAPTAAGWQNCLDKWLIPAIGDVPLAAINNLTLKELVTKMSQAKLSAKTIVTYSGLFKDIVASAVDEKTGNQLFPITWNHEFVDMPIVGKQHQPSFTEDEMGRIVAAPTGMQMLYILVAATGLRIGEALGLELKHLSDDCTTLSVEQSVWQGTIQTPKTHNAVRVVDVPTAVAALLKQYIGDSSQGREGLLFASRTGSALMQSNILRRSLHPILHKEKIKGAGFHAFRRFRTTWLRKQGAHEDFIKGALGHANKSVTDDYSKLYRDEKFRKDIVEKVGVGFKIPVVISVVRSVRKLNKK